MNRGRTLRNGQIFGGGKRCKVLASFKQEFKCLVV